MWRAGVPAGAAAQGRPQTLAMRPEVPLVRACPRAVTRAQELARGGSRGCIPTRKTTAAPSLVSRCAQRGAAPASAVREPAGLSLGTRGSSAARGPRPAPVGVPAGRCGARESGCWGASHGARVTSVSGSRGAGASHLTLCGARGGSERAGEEFRFSPKVSSAPSGRRPGPGPRAPCLRGTPQLCGFLEPHAPHMPRTPHPAHTPHTHAHTHTPHTLHTPHPHTHMHTARCVYLLVHCTEARVRGTPCVGTSQTLASGAGPQGKGVEAGPRGLTSR